MNHDLTGYEEIEDPIDGTTWHVDVSFTDSNWTCVWGSTCAGILDHPAPELGQGCCSVGARMLDDEEALRIGALGLTLDPERFQYHAVAVDKGVFTEGNRQATRVVDGACIFLNRPGFPGGAGCALHLAAEDEDESPLDWKPAVCWQLPLKVDDRSDGSRVLRRWSRSDWGEGGASMSWCCTEREGVTDNLPSAYVGVQPVAVALQEELTALVGREVAVELRRRVDPSLERT